MKDNEGELCPICAGSGEGMYDDTSCTQCNGLGLSGHEPEGWI